MYYKIIDNKKEKWIVLLHCICSNMRLFDNSLDMLCRNYNVLMIDLPGHGKSKDCNDKINFESTALYIANIIEELQINKVSIWGVSLGAVVAKHLLKIIPNKIEKIIFEGPAFAIANKLLMLLFILFNKIKYIIPKNMYIRCFIFTLLLGKGRKEIRRIMYEHLKYIDRKKISQWLSALCNEMTKKDFNVLNNTDILKIYIIGENDYVFKNGVVKNITENKYNNIIIKESVGHLCHLEEIIEV